MKFKLPENLTGSNRDELEKLLADALTEYKSLGEIADEEITDEQLEDLEKLNAAIGTIEGAISAVEVAAAERSERIAAAKNKLPADADETNEDDDAEDGDDDEVEELEVTDEVAEGDEAPLDVVIPDDASELINEEEAVTASGSKKVVRRAKSQAPDVDAPLTVAPKATMVAAGEMRGFTIGQELKDLGQAGEAFAARLAGFPRGNHVRGVRSQVGAFTIKKAIDPRFQLTGKDVEGDLAKIDAASKAQRNGGELESLVAAGGWCAPSQTVYNIPTLEEVDGILNLPEVTIERGGINFTKGPDFESIYAGTGFTQTEAQAEAGTVKPFLEVDCPDFTEVRLDAAGWGITIPLLTQNGYPELVKRFLDGAIVAHAHKMNANKIQRVIGKLGAAINATEFGSAVADTLTALEVQAMRLRYRYRLKEAAKLEGFAPIWLKAALRADLAYQEGVEAKAVTDAQINAWLSARNISLQWIYDWAGQDLTATGTTYPATAQVALYVPGAYVVGTTDVINVDAVYDTAGLKVNEFTGAFFEEGILLFNPVGSGVLAEIALDYHGRSGAKDITSLVAA